MSLTASFGNANQHRVMLRPFLLACQLISTLLLRICCSIELLQHKSATQRKFNQGRDVGNQTKNYTVFLSYKARKKTKNNCANLKRKTLNLKRILI